MANWQLSIVDLRVKQADPRPPIRSQANLPIENQQSAIENRKCPGLPSELSPFPGRGLDFDYGDSHQTPFPLPAVRRLRRALLLREILLHVPVADRRSPLWRRPPLLPTLPRSLRLQNRRPSQRRHKVEFGRTESESLECYLDDTKSRNALRGEL